MRKKGDTRFTANSTHPILSDGRFGSDTRTKSRKAFFLATFLRCVPPYLWHGLSGIVDRKKFQKTPAVLNNRPKYFRENQYTDFSQIMSSPKTK